MTLRLPSLLALVAFLTAGPAAAQLPLTLQSDSPTWFSYLGERVAAIADVNGDAVSDFLVGAPEENAEGEVKSGRVYVFSGADGAVIRTHTYVLFNGQFGHAVAEAGDVDADGVGDYMAGGLNQVPGLVFSGATGALLHAFTVTEPFEVGATALASVGDLNGDGHSEVAVAFRDDVSINTGSGSIRIYDGATGAQLRQITSPVPSFTTPFPEDLRPAGDVDADGKGDLLAMAPFEGPTGAGRVYVFSAATGALLRTLEAPIPTRTTGFGWSAASVGDATGDGQADLLVGELDSFDSMTISAYLFDGATGALVHSLDLTVAASGLEEWLSVAPAGDDDGDGRVDLLIGVQTANSASPVVSAAGQVHVVSGATGDLIRTLQSPSPQEEAFFGVDIAIAGDVNGDGRYDYIIGERGADVAAGGSTHENAGRAHVLAGNAEVGTRVVHASAALTEEPPVEVRIDRPPAAAPTMSLLYGRASQYLAMTLFYNTLVHVYLAYGIEGVQYVTQAILTRPLTPLFLVMTGIPREIAHLYAANPQGIATALQIFAVQLRHPPGGDFTGGDVEVALVNAVTDAPAVDVVATSTGELLADDLSYGESASASLPPGIHAVEVRRSDTQALLEATEFDLSADGGQPVLFLLSGFLDPAANQNGPPLDLLAIDADGTTSTGVEDSPAATPAAPILTLDAPSPNPARGAATLRYSTSQAGSIRLTVYDVLGRAVARLVDAERPAGTFDVRFDASLLPAGTYLVRLDQGARAVTRTLTFAR